MEKAARLTGTIAFNGSRWLQGGSYFTRIRQIPLNKIHNFATSMMKDWSEKNVLCVPTIFDIFRERRISFEYFDWPIHASNRRRKLDIFTRNNDASKVKRFLKCVDRADVFWLRLWDLDTIAHRYGTNSREINEKIRELDNHCRQIIESVSDKYPINFLFWSDHGMVDVEETIDISQLVSDLDLLMFLDSSLARFWVDEEYKKKELIRRLNGLNGKVLSEEDMERYHIRFQHNRYGDIIFLANPGVLIFPNYYQKSDPVKAMHGYVPTHPDQYGMYISSSSKGEQDKRMVDMFDEILRGVDNNEGVAPA